MAKATGGDDKVESLGVLDKPDSKVPEPIVLTRNDQLKMKQTRKAKGKKKGSGKKTKKTRRGKATKKVSRKRKILHNRSPSKKATVEPETSKVELEGPPQPKRPRRAKTIPSSSSEKPKAKAKAKSAAAKKEPKPKALPAKAKAKAKSTAKSRSRPRRTGISADQRMQSPLYSDDLVKTLTAAARELDPDACITSNKFKTGVRASLEEFQGHRLNIYWSRAGCGVTSYGEDRDVASFSFNCSSARDVFKLGVAMKCASICAAQPAKTNRDYVLYTQSVVGTYTGLQHTTLPIQFGVLLTQHVFPTFQRKIGEREGESLVLRQLALRRVRFGPATARTCRS